MRILIADDDLTSRTILAAILKKWGFEIVAAEDGQSVWGILQRPDAPRLVLIDWEMPGMDGLEVCRRLRGQESPDPPYVILLTARSEKSDMVEGLSAGASDFLTKPFDLGELKSRLAVGHRVIELQSALNERIVELSAAMAHVKTLQGIISICMHCHKIRNDTDSWQRIENYIMEHPEALFAHGLCPDCLQRHSPGA